ncbi:hypothetical protein LY78DRAFT_332248 [Colletotrichum sublineola]|nr:hypothetical protein LY78DRAFT_332248 [Colletotrichum sublineola]
MTKSLFMTMVLAHHPTSNTTVTTSFQSLCSGKTPNWRTHAAIPPPYSTADTVGGKGGFRHGHFLAEIASM